MSLTPLLEAPGTIPLHAFAAMAALPVDGAPPLTISEPFSA